MAVVLVADDDETVRSIVRDVLQERLAAHVVEVRDGYEAILWLQEQPCDLVLLDLRMPRVDGWGVLHWLKSARRTAATPVAVITALDAGRALAGIDRLPDAVFGKPFELDAFVATVAELLARAGAAPTTQ
jgi:DNA-binding response OmpR family regulator